MYFLLFAYKVTRVSSPYYQKLATFRPELVESFNLMIRSIKHQHSFRYGPRHCEKSVYIVFGMRFLVQRSGKIGVLPMNGKSFSNLHHVLFSDLCRVGFSRKRFLCQPLGHNGYCDVMSKPYYRHQSEFIKRTINF